MTITLSLTAIFFYLLGTAHQLLVFQNRISPKPFLAFLIGVLAIICHGVLDFQLIVREEGIDLNFFKASVATSWVIVVITAIVNIRKPLSSLLLGAYPIAILSLICLIIFNHDDWRATTNQGGLIAHILFSVTAYSVFTLAAIQACMLYAQNRSLRTNYNGSLIKNLPPLQTMEDMLFEMLYSGVILLTIAIALGFLFIEDLFAQKLVHKTVFSLVSLIVFTTLIIGHKISGWRGVTASKWTLSGSLLLMIGYFGSKAMIELIL
ncbi:MAG: cytochrome C assembly protein [Gammaproteobacteria bacterium]|nr:MAG: cytochrome C assembly protein [Gammaproteobacteria bacterium]